MGEQLHGEPRVVEKTLDSALESVDVAEHMALDLARESGFGEEDLDRIGMAVRECMVNAIVHGNGYSSHKKVKICVCPTPDRFTIQIADEGEGFDPGNLPDPLAEHNLMRHSGRGIFLMKAFMDDLQVRRLEPAGTEVTLIKNVAAKR
jgi:serine/threonine-protein kinase RsbW